jgi:hypothetical protein
MYSQLADLLIGQMKKKHCTLMWYKYELIKILIQPLYIISQFYTIVYTIIYICTLGYMYTKCITIGLQLLMVTSTINGTQVGFLGWFSN